MERADHPPTVTIAMPLGRLSPWFDEALQSALAQTLGVPVLLIANGLTDDEVSRLQAIAVASPTVRLHVFQERVPMLENWNRMFEVAQADYLCPLHDDDILEPFAVEVLVNAVKSVPGCGIYFSENCIIDDNGMGVPDEAPANISPPYRITEAEKRKWAVGNGVYVTGLLIDVAKAKSIGGFKNRLSYSPDWDLYFSLAILFDGCFVFGRLGRYRMGKATGQLTSEFVKSGRSIIETQEQQVYNIAQLPLDAREIEQERRIALCHYGRFVLRQFGHVLDRRGRKEVARVLREGLFPRHSHCFENGFVRCCFEALVYLRTLLSKLAYARNV